MNTKSIAPLCALYVFSWHANAQTYDTNNVTVQTFAGSAFTGYLDGQGQLTMFSDPSLVVSDSSSNLFVWDNGNLRIRKITPDATVTTFAGGGAGSLPGYGTNISLSYNPVPSMVIDRSNAIWMAVGIGVTPYLLRIGSDAYTTRTNLSTMSTSSGLCFDSSNNLYY